MKIYYGKQYIDKKDIKKIKLAANHNKITQGVFVNQFQLDLKKKFKSKSCSASSFV